MRYILVILLFCIASAFSQEQIVDTIYTDTHKVTYIDNTLNNTSQNSKTDATTAPEDTVDLVSLSAVPNSYHRLSLFLTSQSLSFSLGYEYLFSDFWSARLRFGYIGYNKTDIKKHTDAEGTMDIFTAPIAVKWFWARRNLGTYQYVDALGNNHKKSQSQAEGFIHLQAVPTLYNIDIHRDSSSYTNGMHLKEKELALYITAGFGFNLCYERFILTTEMNLGTFVKSPIFQKSTNANHTTYEIYVDNNKYGTHLLEKTVFETIIAIGWVF